MGLSLIIFDCDGVILESVDAKTQAFARVGLEFGQNAADKLVAYHNTHGGVSRVKKIEWLFAEVLHKELPQAKLDELVAKFAEYSLDEVMHCMEVPGVLSVLAAWQGKVPMYVASGAPHQELTEILHKRGLAKYFDGIYGSPPNKVELLRNILAETKIHPSEGIMIGDSSTDLYAAEAVQTRFYGRGEYFKHSSHPWHYDLTQLNLHLESLAHDSF